MFGAFCFLLFSVHWFPFTDPTLPTPPLSLRKQWARPSPAQREGWDSPKHARTGEGGRRVYEGSQQTEALISASAVPKSVVPPSLTARASVGARSQHPAPCRSCDWSQAAPKSPQCPRRGNNCVIRDPGDDKGTWKRVNSPGDDCTTPAAYLAAAVVFLSPPPLPISTARARYNASKPDSLDHSLLLPSSAVHAVQSARVRQFKRSAFCPFTRGEKKNEIRKSALQTRCWN